MFLGLYGIPLLEVFSATYVGYSPVKPEDQLGSISIEANDTLYSLYKEYYVDMNKPSLKYGDELCDVNDVGPICCFTDFDMQFFLFDGAYNGSIEKQSDCFGDGDCLMKTRIPSSVNGYEHISVLFGYFYNATVANLEVVLTHIPAAPTMVYGVVAATNTIFDQPSCTRMLFVKDSANAIQVGCDGVIPLSNARVGLPLDSQLILDICLFCDGEAYKDTAYIPPATENQCSYDILDGRIKVKVT